MEKVLVVGKEVVKIAAAAAAAIVVAASAVKLVRWLTKIRARRMLNAEREQSIIKYHKVILGYKIGKKGLTLCRLSKTFWACKEMYMGCQGTILCPCCRQQRPPLQPPIITT